MKANSKKIIKTSLSKRLNKNRLRFSVKNVILLFISLFLVTLVLYPILMLLIKTFVVNGKLSVWYIVNSLDYSFIRSLYNTVLLAIGVLLGSWVIGGSLALISSKTDYKNKKLIDIFSFLTFTIPSYILCVSWIQLTSKNGYIIRLLRLINPNITYNFKTYSLGAAIVVLSIHLSPLVYFGLKNALLRMGSNIINSARVSGITRGRIIFFIIIPLMIPTLISTGLLVFSRSMANFGVVAQLALPAGREVMTTSIFSAMSNLNLKLACVLSLVLMIISLLAYKLMEKVAINIKYSYDNGSSKKEDVVQLGKLQPLVNLAVIIYFSFTIIIPLITILVSSFVKRWGVKLITENITFSNYIKVFSGEVSLGRAIYNSLSFGIIASLVAIVLTSLTLYIYKYHRNNVVSIAMMLSQLPIAFPNMIIAIAVIFAWSSYPIKLYGTKWIIIIAYTALFIPIVLKQTQGTVDNMDINCDNSARTLGISFIKRFWHIFIPQVKNNLIAGFLTCLLIAFREIPISLLLYTKKSKTLGVMLFTIQSNSYGLEMTSTVAVFTIMLSIIISLTVQKISSKVSERHGIIS